MQTILSLFLIGIATWRVSYMLVFETGPGHIFQKIRDAVGVLDMEDGSREVEFGLPGWKEFLAGIFSCIYCMSIWIGALAAIPFSTNLVNWLLFTLYCSTAAIFVNLIHEKLDDG